MAYPPALASRGRPSDAAGGLDSVAWAGPDRHRPARCRPRGSRADTDVSPQHRPQETDGPWARGTDFDGAVATDARRGGDTGGEVTACAPPAKGVSQPATHPTPHAGVKEGPQSDTSRIRSRSPRHDTLSRYTGPDRWMLGLHSSEGQFDLARGTARLLPHRRRRTGGNNIISFTQMLSVSSYSFN